MPGQGNPGGGILQHSDEPGVAPDDRSVAAQAPRAAVYADRDAVDVHAPDAGGR